MWLPCVRGFERPENSIVCCFQRERAGRPPELSATQEQTEGLFVACLRELSPYPLCASRIHASADLASAMKSSHAAQHTLMPPG